MAAPMVSLEDVTKIYPGRWGLGAGQKAVDRVSLELRAGEVLGLVGPNRAGKTTIVKMILSLCSPSRGTVERFGSASSNRGTLSKVGYVHEHPAFPRYHSAATLLEYYGSLTLVPRPDLVRRIPVLLQQVGLSDRANEPIGRYSKGMVQRLALAQALINAPELLVLDEPNEGLDLAGRSLVHELVGEQRRRSRSVLLVSHLIADIERLCDRLAVLVQGQLLWLGSLADLTRGPDRSAPKTLEQALSDIYAGTSP